jgi:hypothetical protein
VVLTKQWFLFAVGQVDTVAVQQPFSAIIVEGEEKR